MASPGKHSEVSLATASTANNSEDDEDSSDKLECAVCLQTCMQPVRLPCSHVFCYLCVKGVAHQSKRCAMCRRTIPANYLDNPELISADFPKLAFEGSYQWFYEGKNGWWQYDERTSAEIESAFKNGNNQCDVLIAGFLYKIDFANNIQVRQNDPSKRRKIKRDLISIAKKGVAGIRLSQQASVLPSVQSLSLTDDACCNQVTRHDSTSQDSAKASTSKMSPNESSGGQKTASRKASAKPRASSSPRAPVTVRKPSKRAVAKASVINTSPSLNSSLVQVSPLQSVSLATSSPVSTSVSTQSPVIASTVTASLVIPPVVKASSSQVTVRKTPKRAVAKASSKSSVINTSPSLNGNIVPVTPLQSVSLATSSPVTTQSPGITSIATASLVIPPVVRAPSSQRAPVTVRKTTKEAVTKASSKSSIVKTSPSLNDSPVQVTPLQSVPLITSSPVNTYVTTQSPGITSTATASQIIPSLITSQVIPSMVTSQVIPSFVTSQVISSVASPSVVIRPLVMTSPAVQAIAMPHVVVNSSAPRSLGIPSSNIVICLPSNLKAVMVTQPQKVIQSSATSLPCSSTSLNQVQTRKRAANDVPSSVLEKILKLRMESEQLKLKTQAVNLEAARLATERQKFELLKLQKECFQNTPSNK